MKLASICRVLALSIIFFSSFEFSLAAEAQSTFAGKICENKQTKVITVRSRCKRSERVVSTSTSLKGSDGADGSIRVYGDGSAGPLSVTSGSVNFAESNTQFTDCSISLGATLTVPSGTVIRCSGDFTLDGSLNVLQGTAGGVYSSVPSTNVYTASLMPPHPGIGRFAAGSGELGAAGSAVKGGYFGYSASTGEAESFITFSKFGGGGGGASVGSGGAGGGSLLLLVKGQITISGTVVADGADGNASGFGGGGGGGGVVILASQTGVTVQSPGSISVRGGNGGNSSASSAAGGGGAGGLVKIISPSNSVGLGLVYRMGGSAGGVSTPISSTVAYGGGSGGPCIGGGGAGGDVPLGRPATSTSPSAGEAGSLVVTMADPTSLF